MYGLLLCFDDVILVVLLWLLIVWAGLLGGFACLCLPFWFCCCCKLGYLIGCLTLGFI